MTQSAISKRRGLSTHNGIGGGLKSTCTIFAHDSFIGINDIELNCLDISSVNCERLFLS